MPPARNTGSSEAAKPHRPRGATRAHSRSHGTEEQRSGRRYRAGVDELRSASPFAGGLEPSQGSKRIGGRIRPDFSREELVPHGDTRLGLLG